MWRVNLSVGPTVHRAKSSLVIGPFKIFKKWTNLMREVLVLMVWLCETKKSCWARYKHITLQILGGKVLWKYSFLYSITIARIAFVVAPTSTSNSWQSTSITWMAKFLVWTFLRFNIGNLVVAKFERLSRRTIKLCFIFMKYVLIKLDYLLLNT